MVNAIKKKLPRSRADEVLTENILLSKQSFEEFNLNEIKKLKTKLKTELPWPYHWVMYAGELTQNADKVSFKVFSWGGYKTADNSKDFFKDTFYGFIQCKFK